MLGCNFLKAEHLTFFHVFRLAFRGAALTVLLSTGPGEQGRPYPMSDSERVDQAYRENGFNIYVSDRISLNRSLPDIRHPK